MKRKIVQIIASTTSDTNDDGTVGCVTSNFHALSDDGLMFDWNWRKDCWEVDLQMSQLPQDNFNEVPND